MDLWHLIVKPSGSSLFRQPCPDNAINENGEHSVRYEQHYGQLLGQTCFSESDNSFHLRPATLANSLRILISVFDLEKSWKNLDRFEVNIENLEHHMMNGLM